jgi:hypothetical protein
MSGMAGLGRSVTSSVEQLWRRWFGAPALKPKNQEREETVLSINDWISRVQTFESVGANDG